MTGATWNSIRTFTVRQQNTASTGTKPSGSRKALLSAVMLRRLSPSKPGYWTLRRKKCSRSKSCRANSDGPKEARQAIIWDNDTAFTAMALGPQPATDTNQCLAWLASFRAPLNHAMRAILNTVHTMTDANAVADALVWHQQFQALRNMLTFPLYGFAFATQVSICLHIITRAVTHRLIKQWGDVTGASLQCKT